MFEQAYRNIDDVLWKEAGSHLDEARKKNMGIAWRNDGKTTVRLHRLN